MRLALKFVMQNDWDFVRVILIQYNFMYNAIKKVVCVCVTLPRKAIISVNGGHGLPNSQFSMRGAFTEGIPRIFYVLLTVHP